jgi:hypothetical protein
LQNSAASFRISAKQSSTKQTRKKKSQSPFDHEKKHSSFVLILLVHSMVVSQNTEIVKAIDENAFRNQSVDQILN